MKSSKFYWLKYKTNGTLTVGLHNGKEREDDKAWELIGATEELSNMAINSCFDILHEVCSTEHATFAERKPS